jgi:hypothetical protein
MRQWQDLLEGWHELHMDNLLSSPDLCDNVHTKKIHYCPVRHIMTQEFPRIFVDRNMSGKSNEL